MRVRPAQASAKLLPSLGSGSSRFCPHGPQHTHPGRPGAQSSEQGPGLLGLLPTPTYNPERQDPEI